MTADLDKACPHPEFAVLAEVARITGFEGGPAIAFRADLTVSCAECGERFRWCGVPAGLAAGHPTVGVDETELRAPIRPASADPDFGLGIPGFAIQVVDGG